MRQPDDEIRSLDVGVGDAVHMQVLPQQPGRNFLHGERIAQRPERVREPKQKCFSLFFLAESLLSAAALSDIQFNSCKPHYLSIGIAMDLAQTLYPRHGTVGPHDAEDTVKDVVRLTVHDLIPELEHPPAVLFVHTAQPRFKRGRLFLLETI